MGISQLLMTGVLPNFIGRLIFDYNAISVQLQQQLPGTELGYILMDIVELFHILEYA